MNPFKHAAIGGLHALLAVLLGAFAAHGLEGWLSADRLDTFETGVRYHMYHGLGIVLIALAADRIGPVRSLLWSMRLLNLGIALFSLSLYVLSVSGVTWLGAITPLGGIAFIAGWLLFAATLWRNHG
ncbi:DUF423 domain-containing protein [Paenibacillus sp. IB182496]|uniref:DUF423 domain-containing protein n=1 Tax=Paenibacillus sabuli TaxID=2772509 RepID=A0A927GUD2_9BACL|nr:DUF423 domain-containing protein [Paenibacillus sabuli]MBD2848236.1 DUF423 domain-containing protein [Paenibacillus sabuli]